MVLEQLRYTGVLDSIRIRRAGYAVRVPFNDVLTRFNGYKNGFRNGVADGEPDRLRRLLKSFDFKEGEAFVMGYTKVFFKTPELYQQLWAKLEELRESVATMIQRRMRERWQRRKAAQVIQKLWRGRRARMVAAMMRARMAELAEEARKRAVDAALQAELARKAAEEAKRRQAAEEERLRLEEDARLKAEAAAAAARRAAVLAAKGRATGRQGWAEKRGGFRRHSMLRQLVSRPSWKTRYFRLTGSGELKYFTSLGEHRSILRGLLKIPSEKGHISMRKVLSARPAETALDGRANCLELQIEDGAKEPFRLVLETKEEAESWLATLRMWTEYRGRWDEKVHLQADDEEALAAIEKAVFERPTAYGASKTQASDIVEAMRSLSFSKKQDQ